MARRVFLTDHVLIVGKGMGGEEGNLDVVLLQHVQKLLGIGAGAVVKGQVDYLVGGNLCRFYMDNTFCRGGIASGIGDLIMDGIIAGGVRGNGSVRCN